MNGQVVWTINGKLHDVLILVAAGLLKPLGNLVTNWVKDFLR